MRAQNSTKTVDNASQSVKLLVFRFVGKGGAAVRLSMNTRYAVILSLIHIYFLGYSLIRYVGHDVGQAVDPHFDPHLFQRFCNKKHRKPKFSMLFGAGGVTRTHDLLITKCIGVLRLTVFRDFGAFPLGILREVRPILSIVFVRSFPRVGLGVGQTDTSASKKPRMGFAVIFRLAVSLS